MGYKYQHISICQQVPLFLEQKQIDIQNFENALVQFYQWYSSPCPCKIYFYLLFRTKRINIPCSTTTHQYVSLTKPRGTFKVGRSALQSRFNKVIQHELTFQAWVATLAQTLQLLSEGRSQLFRITLKLAKSQIFLNSVRIFNFFAIIDHLFLVV